MIDVKGKATFTLWVCGCNLKCPFCHNWKLAINSPEACSDLQIEKLMSELQAAFPLVDYFHVTGGEPLLQSRKLICLFKKIKDMGLQISLNSNLTLPWLLSGIVDLVDHIATDVKLPEFYGYDKKTSSIIFSNFLKSLDIISGYNVKLELRIPVAKGYSEYYYSSTLKLVLEHVKNEYYLVKNPLLGPPLVQPRDLEWCKIHCYSSGEALDKLPNA